MKIRSLQSVSNVPFGADRSALSDFGSPLRETRNRNDEVELKFDEGVFRFVAGKLVEATFQVSSNIEINGELVEAASLVEYLKQHDPSFREALGFGIAPNLGLAVDLDHDGYWTTAFIVGRWDHIK